MVDVETQFGSSTAARLVAVFFVVVVGKVDESHLQGHNHLASCSVIMTNDLSVTSVDWKRVAVNRSSTRSPIIQAQAACSHS